MGFYRRQPNWHGSPAAGRCCTPKSAGPPTATTAVGQGFYRGGTISWLELDIGADVPREETPRVFWKACAPVTSPSRDSRRISLIITPEQAGRQLHAAWAGNLHGDYPVLMVEQATDSVALADRVRRLHALSDNALLVVFESTLEAVIDRTYSGDTCPLAALRVPRPVERRSEEADAAAGARSLYLGALNSQSGRAAFVSAFGDRVPERHPHLTRLAGPSADRNVVPFLFGLTTYEADYVGLEAYVERSVPRV